MPPYRSAGPQCFSFPGVAHAVGRRYSRAYTPYGPLQSDKDTGWGFIVLRSRYDSGAQRLPASLEKLKQVPNRQPWQVTAKASFPALSDGVSEQDVPETWTCPDCSAKKSDFDMVEI